MSRLKNYIVTISTQAEVKAKNPDDAVFRAMDIDLNSEDICWDYDAECDE